jgi:hypothetical protein
MVRLLERAICLSFVVPSIPTGGSYRVVEERRSMQVATNYSGQRMSREPHAQEQSATILF